MPHFFRMGDGSCTVRRILCLSQKSMARIRAKFRMLPATHFCPAFRPTADEFVSLYRMNGDIRSTTCRS
jgi:hypothetical protein